MTTPVAILTDVTRCTGCEECVKACKETNGLGEDRPWREQEAIDDLSAARFTTIVRRPGDHFVRRQCRHCLEPACVSACIVGALQKTPEGPVIYDSSKCMGCRYCLMACPYDVPRYDWDRAVPYVRKCTLCYDRLQEGGIPACVEACPQEATIFGTREEMLEEARRRLRDNPDRYVQHIYGEREVGGTSVLYVSSIPLGFLGWRSDLGTRPLPQLTWASLKKVPGVIVGMGGVMTGIYWTIGRRMRLAAEQAAAESAAAEATVEVEASPEPADEGGSDND
jgi:formate dehydrogenase iron-sulfur subunit